MWSSVLVDTTIKVYVGTDHRQSRARLIYDKTHRDIDLSDGESIKDRPNVSPWIQIDNRNRAYVFVEYTSSNIGGRTVKTEIKSARLTFGDNLGQKIIISTKPDTVRWFGLNSHYGRAERRSGRSWIQNGVYISNMNNPIVVNL